MTEKKERHGCVNAWLWFVIIANLIVSGACLVTMFGANSSTQVWSQGILAILALGLVLGSILLFRWNKMGFYLFMVSSILEAVVIMATNIEQAYTIVASVFAILVWWAILHIKKDGVSAWSLMEDGFDYAHCRHLYQFFIGIAVILLILTGIVASGAGVSNKTGGNSDDVPVDTLAAGKKDDIHWKEFYGTDKACKVEAPTDFRDAQLNDNQILGLVCSDYDPALFVIKESAKDLNKLGINTAKDYANVCVKGNSHVDGATGYNRINEKQINDNLYLVVYELTVDGTKYRYNLVATKSQSNFYYCSIFCLDDYADQLASEMSHMAESFQALK